MADLNFKASIELILHASAAGMPRHEVVLSLGATPNYLLEHGFSQLELKIKGAVIDKAHFDHGITRGVLERLGDIIASPKALYRSATVVAAAVVITLEQKNGSPILVPLHPDQMVGRNRVNLVASVYSKEASIEARWTKQGFLLWHK